MEPGAVENLFPPARLFLYLLEAEFVDFLKPHRLFGRGHFVIQVEDMRMRQGAHDALENVSGVPYSVFLIDIVRFKFHVGE